MPAGTVAITANGVGQGAGVSIASLIAYAAVNFIFPAVWPQSQRCDYSTVCSTLAACGAAGFQGVREGHALDEESEEYYYNISTLH